MSRSRPLWPLLTAALIGLPVLYVASFGPACWLHSRTGGDRGIFFQSAYWPIGWAARHSPMEDFIRAYATLGMPEMGEIFMPAQEGPGFPLVYTVKGGKGLYAYARP